MSKFFTADLHLGHKNIIDYCDRPFRALDGQMDTDRMREQFVENFNSVMRPGDELYILGDLAFEADEAEAFLKRVPGQKFVAWGNHDPKRARDRDRMAYLIQKSGDILETTLADGTKAVMCHYPMLRWNRGHFGSYMLHGHTHGRCSYPSAMRILDVGVDKEVALPGGLWHRRFFPFSEKEVSAYMAEVPMLKHHYHPGDEE